MDSSITLVSTGPPLLVPSGKCAALTMASPVVPGALEAQETLWIDQLKLVNKGLGQQPRPMEVMVGTRLRFTWFDSYYWSQIWQDA